VTAFGVTGGVVVRARISPRITYQEATASQTAVRRGLDNTPPPEALEAMRRVAAACYEPACEAFGVRLPVSSFYRSAEVNRAVGGARKSQHVLGEAMDVDADALPPEHGVTNAALFWWLAEHVEFDQLIWEFGGTENPAWVHMSYTTRYPNRREMLRIWKEGGRTRREPIAYRRPEAP